MSLPYLHPFLGLSNGLNTIHASGAGATKTGVFSYGYEGGSLGTTMDYITIDTIGNATDFGDLSQQRGDMPGSGNNSTRGLWGGGLLSDFTTYVNTIDYITIATPGNATDFGDLSYARRAMGSSMSDSTRTVFQGGRDT